MFRLNGIVHRVEVALEIRIIEMRVGVVENGHAVGLRVSVLRFTISVGLRLTQYGTRNTSQRFPVCRKDLAEKTFVTALSFC